MHNSQEYLGDHQQEQERHPHSILVRVLLAVHDHGCGRGFDYGLGDHYDRIDHGRRDHCLMMELNLLRRLNLGNYLLA